MQPFHLLFVSRLSRRSVPIFTGLFAPIRKSLLSKRVSLEKLKVYTSPGKRLFPLFLFSSSQID